MEEANTLATRAAIISRRLLAVGTTQHLREKYSNIYYASVILKSAPSSTEAEMNTLRSFVTQHIPNAELERIMLGGQIRFTVPGASTGDDSQDPTAVRLINLLEENKKNLNIECYSVTAATLENVFLSVVKANNVTEDGLDTTTQTWGKRLRKLL